MNADITKINKAFTHAGCFHADDVFATALLLYLNPEIEVIRGFQVPENFDGIVYDIGFGEFDHHQKDRRVRENGVPYGAFGLLWEAFGKLILDAEDAKAFDEEFVQKLDYTDNIGEMNPMSAAINAMNANWDDADSEGCFNAAVELAETILKRFFMMYRSAQKAKEIVESKITNSPVLVLDAFLPWKDAVDGKAIDYVIFPSTRGGYNIQAVPLHKNTIELKKAFPESWRCATRDELVAQTGIKSFSFCHASGFICATDTLEDALKVAELSLKYHDNKGE